MGPDTIDCPERLRILSADVQNAKYLYDVAANAIKYGVVLVNHQFTCEWHYSSLTQQRKRAQMINLFKSVCEESGGGGRAVSCDEG